MSKITPFLWFDQQAEQAMLFYTSIFKNSKVGEIQRYGEGSHGKAGSVMTASFELEGQPFTALNGGPYYTLTPAVSFFISCRDQAEVDHYWEHLVEGGKALQCGWLTDRFGVSWQVVPEALSRLLNQPDKSAAARVMQAMLKMVKLDIAALQAAAVAPAKSSG